jgi:uncharacterized protein YndB with AHSA1/START domain
MTTINEATKPVIKEVVINAPSERVWRAITNAAEMEQWYFNIAEFRPEVGFEFSFDSDCDGAMYTQQCKVTEVITGKRLSYDWKYKGYPGLSHVTFELFEEGDNTRLRLTHTGLETFPQHIKNLKKESFAEGWEDIIVYGFKAFIEKQS